MYNEISNFISNLVDELNQCFEKYESPLRLNNPLTTYDTCEKTCSCDDCNDNENNNHKCKNHSKMRKSDCDCYRNGYVKVVSDDKENAEEDNNLSSLSSISCKKENGTFNIEYEYTNKHINTLEDAVKIMKDSLDGWTFNMRCNKNSYLHAYYIFNNFTIIATWDAKEDAVAIAMHLGDGTAESSYLGYWDEVSGVIKFEDIDGYPIINGHTEILKAETDKSYESPAVTSIDDTVNDTEYNTATYTVPEEFAPEYKYTADNWTSDTNTFTSNDTADSEIAPEKFTTNITAESLYNKINGQGEQSLYDIHVLRAVEKILEDGDYKVSENLTMIWFKKDQIIKNIPNEIIGQLFAGKYATFAKAISDEHLSEIIAEGFKFPLVSVDSDTVWCDLC